MKFIYYPLLAMALLFSPTIEADEIDWARAKSLHQQMKRGQTLSPEDDAYLKKAMAARKGGRSTRGDGTGEKPTVAPVRVSEKDSPVRTMKVKASDGHEIEFAYRVPKAARKLPAVVFFHGGLGLRRIRELQESARTNPTHTRFLDAGYVSVSATFRTYGNEPQSRGPILDAIAIVQAVAKLPEVDAESIVLFGGSGGGSIVLQLAGESSVSPVAVVAGEPATVLYTGLMTELAMREPAMRDYPTLYTEEKRKATEQKIANISCPILIHHGDTHPLKKINFDIVFPAIQKAGKTIEIRNYPGQDHGFYWGNKTTEPILNKVVTSTRAFIDPLLKSKPAG